MKKKILIGSIIAVVLLTLVSFSSVVGYSSVKSNPDNTIITDEYDSYTPIQLMFQLISKLRNHKDIQNVDTEDDVLKIIEGDEELNSIYEQLSVDDCGCGDTYEEWIGPYESGEEVIRSHTWDEQGEFAIKAKAKDIFDAESEWGTLEVTMPVNQQSYSFPLLQRLLELFPNAFPILRYLIGL